MKPLESCANGDGRPIQPPSKVLCKECLEKLDERFQRLVDKVAKAAADEAGEKP